jgi:hypothetical protein
VRRRESPWAVETTALVSSVGGVPATRWLGTVTVTDPRTAPLMKNGAEMPWALGTRDPWGDTDDQLGRHPCAEHDSDAEREPGEAGLDRVVAEDVLHEEGEQVEGSHGAKGHQEHRHIGAGAVPVLEQPQWQEGIVAAGLQPDDDRYQDGCEGEGGRVRAPVQPCSPPRLIAKTRAVRPPVPAGAPARSIRPWCR